MTNKQLTICLLCFLILGFIACRCGWSAEGDTYIEQGVEWTIEQEDPIMQRYKEGDDTFTVVKGKKIPVKIVKEDKEGKDTAWVVIDSKTNKPIATTMGEE